MPRSPVSSPTRVTGTPPTSAGRRDACRGLAVKSSSKSSPPSSASRSASSASKPAPASRGSKGRLAASTRAPTPLSRQTCARSDESPSLKSISDVASPFSPSSAPHSTRGSGRLCLSTSPRAAPPRDVRPATPSRIFSPAAAPPSHPVTKIPSPARAPPRVRARPRRTSPSTTESMTTPSVVREVSPPMIRTPYASALARTPSYNSSRKRPRHRARGTPTDSRQKRGRAPIAAASDRETASAL